MKLPLTLPARQEKPRVEGVTILIDNGVPLNHFIDIITSFSHLIDFVKFGWGTSIISRQLQEKIKHLHDYKVDYFFGGTLFEKFLSQDKVQDYVDYCKENGCKYVEISNGTIDISNTEKAKYITQFSKEFIVFSEIGYKDSEKSSEIHATNWIEWILEDLSAGATKVITEARESGTSGLCSGNGDMRMDLMEEMLASGIPISDIIFEAPNKKMQTYFIKMVGPNVNLANIPFSDAIPLETLRLGLRSDTFNI